MHQHPALQWCTALNPPVPHLLLCDGFMQQLEEFDDGHIPETLRGTKQSSTKWLKNPEEDYDPFVGIFDRKVESGLVKSLYSTTIQSSPWGTYVSIEQLDNFVTNQVIPETSEPREIQALVMKLASSLFEIGRSETPGHSLTRDGNWKPLFDNRDRDRIHGIGFWGLASDEEAEVQYHVDYAEIVRYEENIIIPPLLAGTLQCSHGSVTGGKFCVNLGGRSHYETHGYKVKKQQHESDPFAGWKDGTSGSSAYGFDAKSQWCTIPYVQNRVILHSGSLPHLSSPVQRLDGVEKRVIIGFNFFCHASGPLVAVAPEHSCAFRTRVMQRREGSKRLTVETILKSKSLTRRLIAAKRELMKEQFYEDQKRLEVDIQCILRASDRIQIDEAIKRLCSSNERRPQDVLVRIHHLVLEGKWLGCKRRETSFGLPESSDEIFLLKAQK